tara:strand:+ start:929 stop:1639 length:711 start_codon:yes stop_codon:yes gene_type:complete
MAVDVNKVYQRVLAIANKEQRGYITPQEFNILANQAQLDIFDQYFYDLGQFLRVHGNNTTFADAVEMLKEKISTFEKYNTTISSGVTLPTDLYRLNCVRFNGVEAELISLKDFYRIQNSYLLSPRDEYPIYIRTEGAIKVYGHTSSTNHTLSQKTSNVACDYIKKPSLVNWTYNVVLNNAIYNASASDVQHFEVHESEESNLVYTILKLAGMAIKDPSVYQYGAGEEIKDIQQEKQ